MTKGQRAGDGPIAVEVEKDKSYYWCSCGFSSKQPFCDGSHKDTGKTPVKFVATESKDVFLCNCKKTNDKPFCDGSHSK
jgi:CDGSH-type Zn-finger protein